MACKGSLVSWRDTAAPSSKQRATRGKPKMTEHAVHVSILCQQHTIKPGGSTRDRVAPPELSQGPTRLAFDGQGDTAGSSFAAPGQYLDMVLQAQCRGRWISVDTKRLPFRKDLKPGRAEVD